jgi:excisionase family DNA binding protein
METPKLVCTLAEAAEMAGISQRTLNRLSEIGTGPKVTHIGRRRLILRSTLQAWLQERETASQLPKQSRSFTPPPGYMESEKLLRATCMTDEIDELFKNGVL